MAKKFYAVKNGKNGDGIYDSWEACKAQVHGVKSVVFKGFPTRAEAEDFLQRAGASTTEGEAPENPQREGIAVAYVDGSFSKDTGEFALRGGALLAGGAGALLQKVQRPRPGGDAQRGRGDSGRRGGDSLTAWTRASRPWKSTMTTKAWGKWATGLWKATSPAPKAYAALCKQAMERLQLSFVKVKGHSGNQWNDLADQLGPPGPGQGKIGKVNPISYRKRTWQAAGSFLLCNVFIGW